MLHKCVSALLLSAQPSFSEPYKKLAEKIGVELVVEATWNEKFRVTTDVVILGSKYLKDLNNAYISRAVVILAPGESPAPFIKLGVRRFIFNYQNNYELLTALYCEDPVLLVSQTANDVKDSIRDSGTDTFCTGDYDFRFGRGVFFYRGRQIYLTEAGKKYLAQWLLTGNKDNTKRMTLCKLRKKFGSEFLADIDRFGQRRGGKR